MPEALQDEIIDRLSAALERDPWLDMHHYPVRATLVGGELMLEGEVADVAAKRRALALATQLSGGRWPVVDRVRRRAVRQMGERALRDEIVERLSTEPIFAEYSLRTHTDGKVETLHDAGPDSYEIVLHIEDGAVTLTGTVGSLTHGRLAEALVWWSEACETVDNLLKVVPPEEDNDEEVTDAVRIALEKDPVVDAGQLHIGTAGGVVVLEGLLPNENQKHYAALDAWSVPGVCDVVDRIQVRE